MTIDNRCEKCGGELFYNFDGRTLKCVQCGEMVEIPLSKATATKLVFDETSTIKKVRNENISYKCENCGKNNVFKAEVKTLRCRYCGSPHLTPTSEIEYVPDGIIPFTLNKKEAINSFLTWLKKKKFLPRNLKKKVSQCIFNPIYYPIYNFDFDCFSTYSGVGLTYYKNSNGESTVSSTKFSGTKQKSFNNYVSPATKKLSKLTLVDFANYDFSNLNVFRTEYLYGVTTINPDINLQDSCTTIRADVSERIKAEIKRGYNYDEIKHFICSTTFNNIAYHHLYIPVWLHTFKYKKTNYSVFINGVTGKVGGRIPRSFIKILLTVLGVVCGIGLLVLLFHLL